MSKKLTLTQAHKLAKTNDGKCLSTTYTNNRTKMKWSCSSNHEWLATYSQIKDGSWCPSCRPSKRAHNKLDINHCIELAKSNNGECLSTVYINNKTKIKWRCEKSHVFHMKLKDVKEDHWCPKCSKSKTENKVRDVFETIFNKKFPSIRHPDIVNPNTGRSLELDGYCEELKLAFEYDGEMHYKPKLFRYSKTKSLYLQKKRDELKDDRCKELGITLIRIPYWEKDNLESYIKNNLKELV